MSFFPFKLFNKPSLVIRDPDTNVQVFVPVIDPENANENILQNNVVPKDDPRHATSRRQLVSILYKKERRQIA